MSDSNTNDSNESFYPYRVQQEQASAEIPTPEPVNQTPPDQSIPAKKRLPVVWIALGIVLLLAVIVVGFNSYVRTNQAKLMALTPSPSPSVTPSNTPSPTPPQKISQFSDALLQETYNKTMEVGSMRVGFLSEILTKVQPQDAEPQELTARAEGYFYGTTNGETIQTELRITQTNYPNALPAFFGQILVDNRLFIKRNDDQWEERDRSDFNKLYENQPIDATAYAYNLVDTLFTPSKALLRAIDQNTVKAEADEKIDDKPAKVFSFQFSNADYLTALQNDAVTKEFTLEDARKILANASITGKLYIDPDSKMITRIQLTGTNFTQIAQQEADQQQLGIVMTHDINLVANLLDFNKAVELQAPD